MKSQGSYKYGRKTYVIVSYKHKSITRLRSGHSYSSNAVLYPYPNACPVDWGYLFRIEGKSKHHIKLKKEPVQQRSQQRMCSGKAAMPTARRGFQLVERLFVVLHLQLIPLKLLCRSFG